MLLPTERIYWRESGKKLSFVQLSWGCIFLRGYAHKCISDSNLIAMQFESQCDEGSLCFSSKTAVKAEPSGELCCCRELTLKFLLGDWAQLIWILSFPPCNCIYYCITRNTRNNVGYMNTSFYFATILLQPDTLIRNKCEICKEPSWSINSPPK